MEMDRAFAALGISLGLGLLIGMQRERSGSRFGGIRTFPLIALLGTLCGLLVDRVGGWAVGCGMAAVAAATAVSNFIAARSGEERDPGMTSEIAAVLMFIVGAYAAFGSFAVVLAVGVAVAVLLQAKGRLHGLAAKIGEPDMRAIMVFAAITFIVLPVLPDRTMGPLNVLNPHNIWLMVVLVVGISLGGYVAYKVLGRGAGTVLSGIFGGLISSTATTVTYSRRAQDDPANMGPALLVMVIAGGIVYARLFLEISVTAPSFLPHASGPLAIMLSVSLIASMAVWLVTRRQPAKLDDHGNPTELKSALFFAVLYAVVTLAVAAGEKYFQSRGLFVVASISGLTDMDAITLTTARMVEGGTLAAVSGWKAILIATISNIVFKTGVVAVLGGPRLLSWWAAVAAVKITTAITLILWWK